MTVSFRVDNKVALVTGGSRGLGFMAAEGLIRFGAKRVYIIAREEKKLAESSQTLNNLKLGEVVAISADVMEYDTLEHLVDEISKRENGKLDILIPSAGVTYQETFDKYEDKDLKCVLDLNLRRVFTTIQKFTPLLEKAGTRDDPSRVITVSSTLAHITSFPCSYGYVASKAGLEHLSRTLALELATKNINLNVICPGLFKTRLTQGTVDAIGENNLEMSTPKGRLGISDDIQGAVVFLCSLASNYMIGSVLTIDGGESLKG